MDFISILRAAMKKRGITHLELSTRTGVSLGFPGVILSNKFNRKRPPHIPDGNVEKWADALHLEGAEREEFIIANAWHYASEDQRKVYLALLTQLKEYSVLLPKMTAFALEKHSSQRSEP